MTSATRIGQVYEVNNRIMLITGRYFLGPGKGETYWRVQYLTHLPTSLSSIRERWLAGYGRRIQEG